MTQAYKLRRACRATLLFHGSSLGWDASARNEWREIVTLILGKEHHGDATTKVLCDIQRAALDAKDSDV
jgi:hypothetical protein